MDELTKKRVQIVIVRVGFAIIAILLVFLALFLLDEPRVYVQDLYVPSLSPGRNKTTTFNTSVFIDLKFERAVALTRPKFADFQMTLFYGDNWRLLVADQIVEGFNMSRSTLVHVKATMEAPGLPWEEASRAVSRGEEVKLAVQLVMYPCARNSCTIWSEVAASAVSAYVPVDASGHKVSNKPIKLQL